ncbi:hypothetical protein DYB35_010402 [Aphanomyces astaci]|uniref:Uncharacterized protein n=1 Tax=Aphanomyces astaci TaxID=112090 RepID=A0A418DKL3_APHAT|nr:hypothetical protein DYB35_010402 [Aphanomyces astaci]
MLDRYVKLKPFLPLMGVEEIDNLLLSVRQDRDIDHLLAKLIDLNSVTLELQDEAITLADFRGLFDEVVGEVPSASAPVQVSSKIHTSRLQHISREYPRHAWPFRCTLALVNCYRVIRYTILYNDVIYPATCKESIQPPEELESQQSIHFQSRFCHDKPRQQDIDLEERVSYIHSNTAKDVDGYTEAKSPKDLEEGALTEGGVLDLWSLEAFVLYIQYGAIGIMYGILLPALNYPIFNI